MAKDQCSECGAPGFSHSREHESRWLCWKHFQEWQAGAQEREAQAALDIIMKNPAAIKKLKEALK